MRYYTGCKIEILLPADKALMGERIAQAIAEKYDGIETTFEDQPTGQKLRVKSVYFPNDHPAGQFRAIDARGTRNISGDAMMKSLTELLSSIAMNSEKQPTE